MPKITKIEATINPITHIPHTSFKKRKVAAYARVSTDSEEQLTSYEAQVDYYTQYITNNPEWQFVNVYTDEGITGTNTKKREGFNTMINDALSGKINLIITKSVSRFARNTVDSLVTIRKLKEKGVEVYFEKENIYTFDGKGELLLTIMSSLAQEEARSISENVTWGQRKRFADGKVTMPYKSFLGYRKGADGKPEIVHSEAETIRLIYSLFISGKSSHSICKELEKRKIKSPLGKDKWRPSTVESILTNEKYKGDALLQKSFTVDFLQKKTKKNDGEVPQYYVEDSHPAIIDKQEFEIVQAEIARRKKLGKSYNGTNTFSTKIICGDCGGFYGSKVWHSKDKYRKVIWQCNKKFQNTEKCSTPHINENDIKNGFVKAFISMMDIRQSTIADSEILLEIVTDFTELNTKRKKLEDEIEVISELVKNAVYDNATAAQSQEEYNKHYIKLTNHYEKTSAKLQKVTDEITSKTLRATELKNFIETFKTAPSEVLEFDERLWFATIESVTVMPDGKLIYKFKNNQEIII